MGWLQNQVSLVKSFWLFSDKFINFGQWVKRYFANTAEKNISIFFLKIFALLADLEKNFSIKTKITILFIFIFDLCC